MNWLRSIALLGCLGWALTLGAVPEGKLAMIRLGMTPEEVFALLGDKPDATLIAQPPLVERSPTALSGLPDLSMPGSTPGQPLLDLPNSLVLIYNNDEIEIDAVTTTSGDSGAPGLAQATATDSRIPLFAYVVLSTKLSLDQKEFIYRLNNFYSVGITITGRRREARVTDIIACTYEPLREDYIKKTGKYERRDGVPINFYYGRKQTYVPAGTSKGVRIGSRLDDVLRKHGWPEVFLPFVSDDITLIKLPPGANIPVNNTSVAVATRGGAGASAGAISPLPTPDAGAAAGTAAGEKIVTLTDGQDRLIPTGFARNCLLLYPNDRVALTLVDFIVVRIQIGTGVVRPPDPPALGR
jgi:hypothetical protein